MVGHDAKAFGSENIRPGKSSKWIEKYAYSWGYVAMFHDFMESVAPNKINVNSESHFLSSGQWRDLNARTSYVRSVYWLATLLGMDANTGWFWARDPDGSPEDRLEGDLDFFDPGLGGAYAGSNNMQPHVTNEVTQVMYDLNSFSEEIIELREQPRPLRLFYSETTAINTDDYMTKGYKLYEELFFEGLPLGFVTKNIIEKQDNSAWDTVIVYNNPNVKDDEFNALQSYLDQGGTVVLDAESLQLNEYGQKREQQLKASKGKLIALDAEADIAKIKQVALAEVADNMPDVLLKEDNGKAFKTTTWRTVKQPNGSYLVNILNVGRNTAKLDLSLSNGKPATITNMMTSNPVNSHFELESEGVLLLKVTPK
jgi:beta-galactosidase